MDTEQTKHLLKLESDLKICIKANQSMDQALKECSDKLSEARKEFSKLQNQRLSFKIQKKWDGFWSFMSVLLDPGQSHTSLFKKFTMFVKTMWSWARNGFKLEEGQIALSPVN